MYQAHEMREEMDKERDERGLRVFGSRKAAGRVLTEAEITSMISQLTAKVKLQKSTRTKDADIDLASKLHIGCGRVATKTLRLQGKITTLQGLVHGLPARPRKARRPDRSRRQ